MAKRTVRKQREEPMEIVLQGCGLRELPEWVEHALNGMCATLDVSLNKLTNLGSGRALIGLAVLDLSQNEMEELPAAVVWATQLEVLVLANNELRTLPDEFAGLQQLRTLVISNNKFSRLPASVGALRSLRVLKADNNLFYNFPETVLELTGLEQLDLQFNAIGRIPDTISLLARLQRLDVSVNVLKAVPATLELVHTLRVLRAHDNLAPLVLPPWTARLEKATHGHAYVDEVDLTDSSSGGAPSRRTAVAPETPGAVVIDLESEDTPPRRRRRK